MSLELAVIKTILLSVNVTVNNCKYDYTTLTFVLFDELSWIITVGISISINCVYIDGQAVAIRLSKQINKATAEVKKFVDLYNRQPAVNNLPTTVSVSDALDVSNQIYFNVLCSQEVIAHYSVIYVQQFCNSNICLLTCMKAYINTARAFYSFSCASCLDSVTIPCKHSIFFFLAFRQTVQFQHQQSGMLLQLCIIWNELMRKLTSLEMN